jgi:hypothetical protein
MVQMNEQLGDVDVFLQTIHELEEKVLELIQRSNLTEQEKGFILDHILIVPGKGQEERRAI